MKHTFIFTCTDNGGGYQSFEVRATDKQEAIKKAWRLQRSMLRVISVGIGLAD